MNIISNEKNRTDSSNQCTEADQGLVLTPQLGKVADTHVRYVNKSNTNIQTRVFICSVHYVFLS